MVNSNSVTTPSDIRLPPLLKGALECPTALLLSALRYHFLYLISPILVLYLIFLNYQMYQAGIRKTFSRNIPGCEHIQITAPVPRFFSGILSRI